MSAGPPGNAPDDDSSPARTDAPAQRPPDALAPDEKTKDEEAGREARPMVEYGLRRVIITVTVVTASLLEVIDTTVVNVSIPVIRGNLGATLAQSSWIVAGYTLANAVIVPMTGWLSSVFGRRRYFAGSILLFTFASIMSGNVGSIWGLVFWRIVQGGAGAGLLAPAKTILVETYPEEDLGLANAMFTIGVIVGPTVGPVLGGWLTTSYSWRWIFFINVPVGILAAILTFLYIREPPEQAEVGSGDWLGIFLLVVGVGSLQVMLERGEDENWFQTPYITVLAVVAVIGLALFIWWELREAENPVVDLRVFRHRSMAVGTLMLFVIGLGLYGSVFIFPVFVQSLLGFNAYQSGIVLLPGGLAAMVVLPFVGFILTRGYLRTLAAAGLCLFFVALFLLSNETLQSGQGDFFWPLIFRGVGLGMLMVPLSTLSLSGLKGPEIAQSAGITNMVRQLGGSLGVAMISVFVDHQAAVHRAHLATSLTQYSAATRHRLAMLTQGFMSSGGAAHQRAHLQALGALQGTLTRNVLRLAYTDAFRWVGIFLLACLPLLLLIPRGEG